MINNRSNASNRPVSGYETVLDRPVEVRKNATGDTYYYVDVEHRLILQRKQNSVVT